MAATRQPGSRNGALAAACFAATLVMAVMSSGCATGSADAKFTSFKDPYFPEPLQVHFDHAAYWSAPDNDMHVVARVETSNDEGQDKVRQYLHLRIFWRPYPGRSFANSTTVNAMIRYIVATDEGVITYAGTGFVISEERDPRPQLSFTLESGSLDIQSRTGDAPDVIGAARVTATVQAPRNDTAAARWIRESELLEVRGARTASR